MDRRIERTRSSIINAFLELRSKKSIERISVRELCEKANINKSTFYTHYQDIYDLTGKLENQLASDILREIGSAECMLLDPGAFVRKLYYAYHARANLIKILFSGSREGMLIVRIEESLMESLERVYPGLKDNVTFSTLFTLEIYGQFYAYMEHRNRGDDAVISILSEHWLRTVEYLREYAYVPGRTE